jgi:holin-like protein
LLNRPDRRQSIARTSGRHAERPRKPRELMIETLATLLVFQTIGEVLAFMLKLPVPGPVIGMAMLVAWLRLRPGTYTALREASLGLLRHLSLLFVPAGVGVMLHAARLEAEWPAILAAIVVSTALTIAVTALVFRLVARLLPAGDEDEATAP